METNMDRWDLSYLYTGFEDEAFRQDLDSLRQDGEAIKALLADETLPEAEAAAEQEALPETAEDTKPETEEEQP